MHCSPLVQAEATPQRQPVGPQLFAVNELQAAHCAPGAPHWLMDVAVTQVVPLQQPVGQVVASHTHCPLTQRSDAPQTAPVPQRQPLEEQVSARAGSHAVQAAPPVPHSDRVPGERHAVPLQQPEEHEDESQTHWLLRQREPALHAGPVPHLHPVEPQLFASVRLQLTHWAPPVPH